MTRYVRKALTLKQRKVGSAVVVCVSGSADINDSDKLEAELAELAGARVPLIVLDLSEMDFICSQGLGAIITGHLKSRHHKGQIRLVNPQPHVRELLETTRLTKLFPIDDSVDEAVASQ